MTPVHIMAKRVLLAINVRTGLLSEATSHFEDLRPLRSETATRNRYATGYRLPTRDIRRYRTYFPTVDISAPPQAEGEPA